MTKVCFYCRTIARENDKMSDNASGDLAEKI